MYNYKKCTFHNFEKQRKIIIIYIFCGRFALLFKKSTHGNAFILYRYVYFYINGCTHFEICM